MTGEVCTRGYHVMTGYFRDPAKTAAAIDADGWLHTGDLVSMDERGYCQIAGRLTDMIIRGGENIYPREIEQVLFGHPAVADVAVVGVPDAKWGEQVAAFIRPAPGQTPDPGELFAYCREHLAPHKSPRYWTVIDQFPSRHRARSRNSCCASASSPAGLTSRYRPKAQTPLPQPHPPMIAVDSRARHASRIGRRPKARCCRPGASLALSED